MLRKKIAAFVAIPTLAFSLAACGNDGKPSKEDVSKGLTKILSSQPIMRKAPSNVVEKLSSCTADKIYDKMSNENLKAIADGKEKTMVRQGKEKQFQKDKEALSSAARECATKFRKELMQGK